MTLFERDKIRGVWHTWFAWHPVRDDWTWKLVWLRRVHRRRCESPHWFYYPFGWWEYRA